MFLVAQLLLRYCIAHALPWSGLVAVMASQRPPMSSLVFDSHGRCSCVYVCFYALLYGVCAVTSQCSEASQRQQYNGSRVLSSCLCASSHGECVWLVHSRRSNRDNIFSSDASIKHIVEPLTRYTGHTAVAEAVTQVHIIGTCRTATTFSHPMHQSNTSSNLILGTRDIQQ